MSRKLFYFFSFLLVSLVLIILPCSAKASTISIDPQYIFVRKDPMTCNPSDCSQLWNMNNPNLDFYPGIIDVYNKVGTHGNEQRKLGIGVLIYYNEYDFENVKQSLRRLLEYSTVHTVPLFLALDGFQWWDQRSDLWNFWDPNQPGYNPENKNNVEWTCGDSSCAIKKAWRNWGFEFKTKPHPNLASRSLIEANKQRLRELIPIISDWYQELPADKKWLLGGISLGIEVDIGANYYYYKNGVSTGGGLKDSTQLGYAAITTLGLPGGVTTANLNEAIRRYLNELDKLAYELGIPRNKIFNHTGGFDISPNPSPPGLIFPSTDAAVNEGGYPGWSFYGEVTGNPQNFSGLSVALNRVNSSEWASPEWLTFAGNYQGWVNALGNSLNYRNNRFVNIANWEGIRDKKYILNALRTLLSETPSCWVTSLAIEQVAINGNQVTLSWTKGQNNQAVYLNISTNNEMTVSGGFKTVDVANVNVTNQNSWIQTLGNGTYYWLFAADGCDPVQRRFVYGTFTVGGIPGDLNSDGRVDILDLRQILANFTNIFDYNQLVANYGR